MAEKMTFATLSVLQAVAQGQRYGFSIMDATGLPSGTVYPILGRLEDAGWVRSRWEAQQIAHSEKRPPRRYYAITPAGTARLNEALESFRALTEPASEAGAATAER